MVIDQGWVNVTDLAKAIGVSEVTIRQDLSTLEKLSYFRHAYGFAVPFDSDDVETHMMSSYTLERELAEFAASLVQPSETIFIENNSSNILSARTLDEQKRNVVIVTVSNCVTHLLKDVPCEVILLDGVYQKKSGSMVGLLTCQYIQQMHSSKIFIGADGWQPGTGFTGCDMVHADVVDAVLEKEYEAIVLTDSPKFGAVHSYSIGPVERFNRVVTDSKICVSDLMRPKQSKFAIHVVDI